jgi:two-component system sensor histidine kinase PilS (NtrC family)
MQGVHSLTLTADLPQPGPDKSESLWRSLHFFNMYRLAVASVFLFIIVTYGGGLTFGSQHARLFLWTSVAYWLAALFFVFARRSLPLRFGWLLTLQVGADIVMLTLLMYSSGGHRSGIPFMLLVVLAGAGLVGQGRSALIYASLASIALLLEQGYRSLALNAEPGDFVQVGLISIGCFAIAVTARLLASKVIANEQLARQRGIDLANQLRINDQVIREMQDGVLVVDSARRVRQHNPQAEALLGVVPPAAVDLSVYSVALAQRLERLEPAAGEASATILAPGSGKSLLARFIAAGEAGDWLIYLEDLDRAQRRAQQLKLAALGRLTGSIAHEIRNPLSAISHAAELLREEKRADMQARLTRIINDNSKRLERMVRDVLELGRRDRVEPETIALEPFLEAFLEEFCMHEKAEREVFEVRDLEAATLVFDRAHLNQVLWNLLRNALRFCSGTAGALKLHAVVGSPGQPAANRLELHVVDDGNGIAAEARGHIFEPFFTTDSKGSGLGLYIARELCEANGAALELLDNSPGAHFRITGRNRIESS